MADLEVLRDKQKKQSGRAVYIAKQLYEYTFDRRPPDESDSSVFLDKGKVSSVDVLFKDGDEEILICLYKPTTTGYRGARITQSIKNSNSVSTSHYDANLTREELWIITEDPDGIKAGFWLTMVIAGKETPRVVHEIIK